MQKSNINEFLLSLGWQDHGFFVREMYHIGNTFIFAYEGNKVGYYDAETKTYVYCNLSEDNLRRLTDIAIKLNDIEMHPNDHKLSEHLDVMSEIMKFISQLIKSKNESIAQKDKELLLFDILGRLQYGVKAHYKYHDFVGGTEQLVSEDDAVITGVNTTLGNPIEVDGYDVEVEYVKPYLRPMSSMTEEEKQNILRAWNIKTSFVGSMCDAIVSDNTWWGGKDKSEPLGFDSIPFKYMSAVIDWLNEHHFDYRGLIEKGLALEAPESMY